jgi:hypothetical protein
MDGSRFISELFLNPQVLSSQTDRTDEIGDRLRIGKAVPRGRVPRRAPLWLAPVLEANILLERFCMARDAERLSPSCNRRMGEGTLAWSRDSARAWETYSK